MAWADKSIHGYRSTVQLSLVELFHQFENNVRRLKTEIGDEEFWASIGPNGNIYRLNALDKEHLKHQWNMHCQLSKLADHFGDILDRELRVATKSESGEITSPRGEVCDQIDETNLEERRRKLLVQHLLTAAVYHDVEEGSAPLSEFTPHVTPSMPRKASTRAMYQLTLAEDTGFSPIAEFICPEPPIQVFWFLLPGDAEERQRYMKNRFVGVLVCFLQIFGPLFIVLDDWQSPTNPFQFGKSFTYKELLCLGTSHEILIAGLGTLFLLVIFEVVRAYTRAELSNFDKCTYLPADNFWMRLGAFTNMMCILTTVLAMPLVFWSELAAKDIIFDALAMMFVLSLDDITHETFAYLGMEDNDFRRICTWSIALLGQCPLKLTDVVNMDAEDANDIWHINMGKKGLLNATTGERCVTRLMEAPANEASALLPADSTFRSRYFSYSIEEGTSEILPNTSFDSVVRFLWLVMCYLLIVLEVIIPVVFFVINKPCFIGPWRAGFS